MKDKYYRFSVAIPQTETELIAWLEAEGASSGRNRTVLAALKRLRTHGISEGDKLDRILEILAQGRFLGGSELNVEVGDKPKISKHLLKNILKELDDD